MKWCSDSNGMASIRGYAACSALPVHSEFGGEGIKRAFRRIAFHLPDAFLLEQLSVVAEHRDPPNSSRTGSFPDRIAVFLDLARR